MLKVQRIVVNQCWIRCDVSRKSTVPQGPKRFPIRIATSWCGNIYEYLCLVGNPCDVGSNIGNMDLSMIYHLHLLLAIWIPIHENIGNSRANCCENWIPWAPRCGNYQGRYWWCCIQYRDKQCIAEKYADSYWIGIKVDVNFGKLFPYQTVAWVYLFLPKIRLNHLHEPPTSIGWKFINMKRIFNMKALNWSRTGNLHGNFCIFTYMFSITKWSMQVPGDSIRSIFIPGHHGHQQPSKGSRFHHPKVGTKNCQDYTIYQGFIKWLGSHYLHINTAYKYRFIHVYDAVILSTKNPTSTLPIGISPVCPFIPSSKWQDWSWILPQPGVQCFFVNFASKKSHGNLTHRIHGTGIFTYIYHTNQPNVGKYTRHGWYG